MLGRYICRGFVEAIAGVRRACPSYRSDDNDRPVSGEMEQLLDGSLPILCEEQATSCSLRVSDFHEGKAIGP